MAVFGFELASDASWFAVTPSVLRYLTAFGQRTISDPAAFGSLSFNLGRDHPAYAAIGARSRPGISEDAWYVRIPDLPAFITHIAPAIESRLAASPLAGHTGELKLSFYRSGLHMVFAEGRLTAAEPWRPVDDQGVVLLGHPDDGNDATFPDLTFTELLLGYRSLDDLEYAHADCRHRGDLAPALLRTLFPQRTSHLAFG